MIKHLEIRDPETTPVPHWNSVKALKGVDGLDFKPGLNILFAPNGVGKSTVIGGLARLLHCFRTNWPVVTRDSVFEFNKRYMCNGLFLHHDGAPARYMGLEEIDFAPDKKIKKVNIDLQDDKTLRVRSLGQQSSGQAQLTRLTRFLGAQPEVVRASITRASIGKDFHELYDIATESLKKVPKGGKSVKKQQVILLDEVDKSLDFSRQSKVWLEIDRLIATGEYQIIVASHSPFAAKYSEDECNYIELVPGYLDASRKALAGLVADFTGMKPEDVMPKKVRQLVTRRKAS